MGGTGRDGGGNGGEQGWHRPWERRARVAMPTSGSQAAPHWGAVGWAISEGCKLGAAPPRAAPALLIPTWCWFSWKRARHTDAHTCSYTHVCTYMCEHARSHPDLLTLCKPLASLQLGRGSCRVLTQQQMGGTLGYPLPVPRRQPPLPTITPGSTAPSSRVSSTCSRCQPSPPHPCDRPHLNLH